jgi:hypothetical protein
MNCRNCSAFGTQECQTTGGGSCFDKKQLETLLDVYATKDRETLRNFVATLPQFRGIPECLWGYQPVMNILSPKFTDSLRARCKPVRPLNLGELISDDLDAYMTILAANPKLKIWYSLSRDMNTINFLSLEDLKTEYFNYIKEMEIYQANGGAFIINTKEATGPSTTGLQGSHWVCIFIDNIENQRSIEFFNSLGIENWENLNENIRNFIQKLINLSSIDPKDLFVGNPRVQTSSTECGMWCLWYITTRATGTPRNQIFPSETTVSQIVPSDEQIRRLRNDYFIWVDPKDPKQIVPFPIQQEKQQRKQLKRPRQ